MIQQQYPFEEIECEACSGIGSKIKYPCQTCSGEGSIIQEFEKQITIDKEKESLILPGEGHMGKNRGRPGDLIVTVKVK